MRHATQCNDLGATLDETLTEKSCMEVTSICKAIPHKLHCMQKDTATLVGKGSPQCSDDLLLTQPQFKTQCIHSI